MKKKEEEEQAKKEAIKRVVNEMLEHQLPIENIDRIVEEVKERQDMVVTKALVKKIMKYEMSLNFRMAKKIP